MADDIRSRLKDIRTRLDAGEASPTPTVREFLSWVHAQRRGYYIVDELRQALKKAGLETTPDFESAHIDAPLSFVIRQARQRPQASTPIASAGKQTDPAPVGQELDSMLVDEPRYLISRLAAADRMPVSVAPTASLQVAVTKMMTEDFSQLPVMSGERDVKGVISWQTIAQALATRKGGEEVRHFMGTARIMSHDDSLLLAMREVSVHGYVLVRGSDHRITGIVTTADINEQFMVLTEPFLLIGEIEQSLRTLLDPVPKEKLRDACGSVRGNRQVNRPADMMFGEYIRVLEDEAVWADLDVPLDRAEFIRVIDEVRQIRNDVMHFDPDGIPESSVSRLRNLIKTLDYLRR